MARLAASGASAYQPALPTRRLPGFLSEMYGVPPPDDGKPELPEPGPAFELDCLRRVFAPVLLHAAEARSREVGTGADRVLIQWGLIDEDAYLHRLALHTGIALEPLSDTDRGDVLLRDYQFPYAAEHQMLPLQCDGEQVLGVTPRGFAARRLCRLAATYPDAARRLRLITPFQLNQFLTYQARTTMAQAAVDGLQAQHPSMSAAPVAVAGSRWRRLSGHVAKVIGVAALMMLPPAFAVTAWSGLLAVWFLAFAALRLCGAFVPRRAAGPSRRLPDAELPVYSIIVALYREATSVAPLMTAINALDYPREKLDIILAIEPDDLETRAAIARLGAMPHVRALIAPAVGPRTKPKALNWALPFARGTITAVFDAEDRPEPGQLRAALEAFLSHPPDTACVQASLCIENLSDSWLARMFATEYAGQFDVFLPGLATLGLPLPLGGSSNHFRTDLLRKVGGWDAYNVTEDADLGFRLARFGYRTVTFASTTDEEAPARFRGWVRQRSRWMKGWMQTWSVHMRAPRRLWRESGPRGFLSLNVLVGGNVLTALAYPILLYEQFSYLAAGTMGGSTPAIAGALTWLHLAAIAAGFVSTISIGLMGLARRNRLRSGWVLVLTPLYWACLSIAAWRALYQLLTEPYRWEKTEHGLARGAPPAPSRQTRTSSPQKSGVRGHAAVKDTVSNPPPRRPASASG